MIKLSPKHVQWAIAAAVPVQVLERLARDLPIELQTSDGARVVRGQGEFCALLVFGDYASERLARLLLDQVTPTYLLDFDDDAPRTIRLERRAKANRERRLRIHPADFLEEHGIAAPGYHLPPSPMRVVGILEGATVQEVRRVMPKSDLEFRDHPRGVLVVDESGLATSFLAEKLSRIAYVLFYNSDDGDFSCSVYRPGAPPAAFSPRHTPADFDPLHSILEETTLGGILRVLSIPQELIAAGDDD